MQIFFFLLFLITPLTHSRSKSPYSQTPLTIHQTISHFPSLLSYLSPQSLPSFLSLIEKGPCHDQNLHTFQARFAIINGQVHSFGPDRHYIRIVAYAEYLTHAIIGRNFPEMYFLIDVLDGIVGPLLGQWGKQACEAMPMFVFNKNMSDVYSRNKFLLPDTYITGFLKTGQEGDIKKVSKDWPWEKKISKMYFRGDPSAPHFYDVGITQNTTQQDLFRYFHRGAFIILSLKYPNLIDAKFVNRNAVSQLIQKNYGINSTMAEWQPFVNHIKYKYLLSADGKFSTWMRNQYIMFSNCVLFKTQSQHVQWFYNALIPNQNFISINDDLSNIFTEMQRLEKDPQKAISITKEANKVAEKWFTKEGIMNFTRNQLLKYASIQQLKFTPEEKWLVKLGVDVQLVLKQRVLKEQWSKNLEFVAFDNIVKRFPFLEHNVNAKRILGLLRKGKCKLHLSQFLIATNKVYCFGELCLTKIALQTKKMIERISKKLQLPDLFFYLHVESNQDFPQQESNCKQIPIFTISKNISKQEQQARFLLPDPTLINEWANQFSKFKETFKIVEWNYRQNSTYCSSIKIQQMTDVQDVYHYRLQKLQEKFPYLIVKSTFTSEQRQNQQNLIDLNLDYKYQFVIPKIYTKASLSYLLAFFSGSVVLAPERNDVLQWWDQKIIPGVHFLPISKDVIDVKFLTETLNQNDRFAKNMTIQAINLAEKWLKQSAIQEHIIQTFKKYAGIQKLNLSKQQKQEIVDGKTMSEIQLNSQIANSKQILSIVTVLSMILLMVIGLCFSRQKPIISETMQPPVESSHSISSTQNLKSAQMSMDASPVGNKDEYKNQKNAQIID